MGKHAGFALLVAALAVAGCNNPFEPDRGKSPPAPARSISTLLAAPDSLQIAGVGIRATAYVSRNFQPTDPDTRLAAGVQLITTPGYSIVVRPKYVWVIRGGETWGAALQIDFVATDASYVQAHSFGGPEWPVEDSVRTIVGIPDSTGVIHLLRCPDGTVNRLD